MSSSQCAPPTVTCDVEGQWAGRTVVVLGDSASVGFGTAGRSFPSVLAAALGAGRLEVVAERGRTTRQMLEDWDDVAAAGPDLVVVQSGVADSLLHPAPSVQRILEWVTPRSWHGRDGLERRAVYSPRRGDRYRQHLESTLKSALKRAAILLGGGQTRLEPDEFGRCLDRLLTLAERRRAIVVSVAPYCVDGHTFPRQAGATRPFREVRLAVLARHPTVIGVEPDRLLRRWEDYLSDRGHWNASGHARVAEGILAALGSIDARAGGATTGGHPVVDLTASGPGFETQPLGMTSRR